MRARKVAVVTARTSLKGVEKIYKLVHLGDTLVLTINFDLRCFFVRRPLAVREAAPTMTKRLSAHHKAKLQLSLKFPTCLVNYQSAEKIRVLAD